MRLRARVDSNQKEIVAALRKAGRSVLFLHQLGKGTPDLLVGNGKENILLELKAGKGNLTEDQVSFHQTWNGPIVIARDKEEAIYLTTLRE